MRLADTASSLACWRLDTPGQTLVFASRDGHLPGLVYWGGPLPADEDLKSLAGSLVRPLTPGTLDRIAELSICPEDGRGFPGQPGLRLRDAAGRVLMTQFQLVEARADGRTILFRAADPRHGDLRYEARFVISQ